jgi:hypothetical protein
VLLGVEKVYFQVTRTFLGWRENEKTKCMNEIDMKKEIN